MIINDNVSLSDNEELINTIVMSVGKEYFPEFCNQNEKHIVKPTSSSCDDPKNKNQIVDQECQKESLTEDDFIQAIPDAVNLFDESVCYTESYDYVINASERDYDNYKESKNPCAESHPAYEESKMDDSSELILSPYFVPDLKASKDLSDINSIRADFPILSEKVNGKDLVWFDNAATTQKPYTVIDRLNYYYEHENSNVHRGAHTLAARTTDAYEGARTKIASFLNAADSSEIVFVRGATEAINLVAQSYGMDNIEKDDEIIISHLEHHANIVPWQMVCNKTGANLKIIPVDESGQIILSEYKKLLNTKTKIVSFTHVSNALGTITPVVEIVNMAHQYGSKVLVDGAQAVSHLKVDVQKLGCDFYVFSGHKVLGPTGIGVLYSKKNMLDSMQPYQGGGNMIDDVTFQETTYKSPPHRFEAGTGSIADAIGLGSAIDYITNLGLDNIFSYEHQLLKYGTESLCQIPGLSIVGTAKQKASIISFILDGFTTRDVGKALDHEGIAVRAGHHCAQPIIRKYGLESTVRVSLAFYNTRDEIDTLVAAIWKLVNNKIFPP